MARRMISIILMLICLVSCLSGCQSELDMKNFLIDKPSTVGPYTPAICPMDNILGTWIASVTNIDYPSRAGLDDASLARELDSIVNVCASTGLNTIFFQVRPTSDALYKSKIFPLSLYLTGGEQRMATDEDFDPLAYLIKAAHARGIAVHAWINPMRISVGTVDSPKHDTSIFCTSHPASLHPEYVVKSSNGCMFYNVGMPEVRELIADGVREIVNGYDVDGVVFDDYFYPYSGGSFDDAAEYAKYGGGMSLGDFRRECVNDMIRLCGEVVHSSGGDVLFGVAPFGIWQNQKDDPRGSETSGLNAYTELFCDALAWAKRDYVDYIAPQLYWTNDTTAAPYDVLCQWWSEALAGTGCAFLVAHSAHRYNTWENPEGVATYQHDYASSFANYRGSVFYGYSAIRDNVRGVRLELLQIARKME